MRAAKRWRVIGGLLLFLVGSVHAAAQDEKAALATTRALGHIFADRHIADSALVVHRKASSLPLEERYAYLAKWVLPSAEHASFRLEVAFTPTHPAPPVDSTGNTDEKNEPSQIRVSRGGKFVSPALDLVAAAKSLRRLDELRQRLEAVPIHEERQGRAQLSLLGVTSLAAGDFAEAGGYFSELFSHVEQHTYADFAGRWPETIAVQAAVQEPETRPYVFDMLQRMLQSQVRGDVARGPAAWDRWVAATAGRLREATAASDWETVTASLERRGAGNDAPAETLNWGPVSKTSAWSRGQGLPAAQWHIGPGIAENFTSHDADFLYYRIPLRGNFQVECDVSGFQWRESHLMVAGTYVAPQYDHVSYLRGIFRGPREPGVIAPRLSECGDWIRYRAVVRDGECFTYFNGRLIHIEKLPEDPDPWIAIRSDWFADGAVRNLTIDGDPVIPSELQLPLRGDLLEWSAYFDEPIGGQDGHWQCLQRKNGDAELLGHRQDQLAGLAVESILQYHRPLLEDGTVDYEFYYRPGESLVHPALDRRVFVLGSDGVRIHWLSDGRYERLGLSPDNLSTSPLSQSAGTSLPLRENTWNQMRVSLAGEEVNLFLNGKWIHKSVIEPGNHRTLGFFHWSDQTEARVRRIVYRGNWPKALPPADYQQLAGDIPQFLDERLAELQARFSHDFTRDGFPRSQFDVFPTPEFTRAVTDSGLHVQVRSEEGFAKRFVTPKITVHGDFDIRATFEGLMMKPGKEGSAGIFLTAICRDPETTHGSIYRGRITKADVPDRQIMQAETVRIRANENVHRWLGTTAEESTSGTLRLARRGDTLYFLLAEHDSPHFRLCYVEPFPSVPTLPQGIWLVGAAAGTADSPSELQVIWKSLTIYAESLAGAALSVSE